MQHIAASNPGRSPVSSEELSRLNDDWQRRTFTGSGSSTAFNRVAQVRPAHGGELAVGVGSGRDAAEGARRREEDAIARVVDSIRPIEISKGKTVGNALDQPDVRRAVMDWLAVRPVIRVEYRLDLSVEITMAGTPNGLFDTVRHAVIEHSDLPIPRDEAGWAVVRHNFQTQMAVPAGGASRRASPGCRRRHPRGGVSRTSRGGGSSCRARGSAWVGQRVDVEAVADLSESKLKGAARRRPPPGASWRRRSRAHAASSAGVTVGKAAEQDARVRDAVYTALDKARTDQHGLHAQEGGRGDASARLAGPVGRVGHGGGPAQHTWPWAFSVGLSSPRALYRDARPWEVTHE